MQTVELRIGVSAPTGIEGANLAGTLYLPEHPTGGAKLELLVCLHGGGYDRRYWQPDIPGYNFAEYFTARGYAVLALDMLGMGRSTRPEPERQLTRQIIATAHDFATRQVAQDLYNGTYASAAKVTVTGIGHSMGRHDGHHPAGGACRLRPAGSARLGQCPPWFWGIPIRQFSRAPSNPAMSPRRAP